MKTGILRLVTLLSLLAGGWLFPSGVSASNVSATDPCASVPEGVQVSLTDLLSKVYGLIPAEMSEAEMNVAAEGMGLIPAADEGGLWLDGADGYRLSYAGVSPEVSARAEYSNGELAGFTYYFLFPYECDRTRQLANLDQCRFCGSMLQEMADMGMEMGADAGSDELVDASGSYGTSQVEFRLLDDDNRYLVILSVTPGAFTDADNLLAAVD